MNSLINIDCLLATQEFWACKGHYGTSSRGTPISRLNNMSGYWKKVTNVAIIVRRGGPARSSLFIELISLGTVNGKTEEGTFSMPRGQSTDQVQFGTRLPYFVARLECSCGRGTPGEFPCGQLVKLSSSQVILATGQRSCETFRETVLRIPLATRAKLTRLIAF